MNILEEALNKVSRETLDQMAKGQTIVLNERYELYSYFDEDYFVIRDTDESVDDEIFSVQLADYNEENGGLVYTDFYGYDEIEQSLIKLYNMNKNKVIAEFMGFTSDENLGWDDNNMMMPQIVYDTNGGNDFDELLFDQSWDWLMPVVEKCIDIYHIELKNDDLSFKFYDCIGNKERTYNTVVRFINEYNKTI